MSHDTAALSLIGVSKVFSGVLGLGRHTVLDRVDLTVQAGAALAITGPNGAGKSTLLGLCAGMLRPSEGTVRVFGETAHQGSSRQHCVLAPRADMLPRDLTPNELLRLLGTGHLRENRSERMDAVTHTLELGDVLNRPMGTLSMGFCARVALACALLPQRPLLLLDEPLTALDPKSKRVAIAAMAAERARGTTLVIATHDVSQWVECCDLVAQVSEASVHPLGTLEQVLNEMPSRLSYTLPREVPLHEDERRMEPSGLLVVTDVDARHRSPSMKEIRARGGHLLAMHPQSQRNGAVSDEDPEETLA